ncbi:MAG TPA: DUF4124 domain-containing protein [Geothrix sp.]|nr:DUF4124 domain-containing protein [Geothrix sp.]
MITAAGLLLLALLGQGPGQPPAQTPGQSPAHAAGQPPAHAPTQAQPRTYYWRDASGQTHITNTPPPANAEILEPPPPPAVEPGKGGSPELIRQSASRGGRRQVVLNPAQQQAWEALNQRLAKARAEGDRRTLEAVTESLIQDCLWGNGLWAMPIVPIVSVLLLGLMGWWLALGLRLGSQIPLVGGFLVLGLAFGHLLLNVFLYHPQAVRLRQNLELLEHHMGTGKAVRPEHRTLLQQRYQALEQASEPIQPPWRFPAEVQSLREAMKQVMVEP